MVHHRHVIRLRASLYEDTPAGEVRRALASGSFPLTGDARKMTQIMIDSATQRPAAKRLTLGSTAYASIHKALSARLEVLESQEELARASDNDA